MSANRCSLQEGPRGVGLIQLLLVLVVIAVITMLALRMYQRSALPPVGGGTTHPARAVLDNVTLRIEGLKSDMDALQVAEALRHVPGVDSAQDRSAAGGLQSEPDQPRAAHRGSDNGGVSGTPLEGVGLVIDEDPYCISDSLDVLPPIE